MAQHVSSLGGEVEIIINDGRGCVVPRHRAVNKMARIGIHTGAESFTGNISY